MDDLISRREAMNAVSNWLYDTQTTETSDEVLLKLPSVQPERKKGKWIPVCGNKQCDCSVCNEGYDHTFEFIEKWKFCPNCGSYNGGENDQSK